MEDDELDGIFHNVNHTQTHVVQSKPYFVVRASAVAAAASSLSSSSISAAAAAAIEKFQNIIEPTELSSSIPSFNLTSSTYELWNSSISRNSNIGEFSRHETEDVNNYWALLALVLVLGTAAGNILVCLAIAWERRLQNVTNYFLMSLAITDLMVAILVMPLGILTLVKGYFPLGSEHCLTWICLDVLFCTASIMHLCTISVDRYLSLRYPMRFGRNKTRRRVTLKIVFVWLLSIAMSLPLSLMYSKDHASVLVNGTCQIPDPVYKFVGSIVCFYIPLVVMLLTYCLTVRLLARQRQNLGGSYHPTTTGWASGWLGQTLALERRRKLKPVNKTLANHAHSATSTDTELSALDTHELWLPDSCIQEPTPSTMPTLHLFGAEMLKLSEDLETATDEPLSQSGYGNNLTASNQMEEKHKTELEQSFERKIERPSSPSALNIQLMEHKNRRRASISTSLATYGNETDTPQLVDRKRCYSLPKNAFQYFTGQAKTETVSEQNPAPLRQCLNEKKHRMEMKGGKKIFELPPPCTCPYFGDKPKNQRFKTPEVKIVSSSIVPPSVLQNPTDLIVTVAKFAKCGQPKTLVTTTNVMTNKKSPLSPSRSNTDYLPLATEPPPILRPESSSTASQLAPLQPILAPRRKLSYSKTASVVTWDSTRHRRRGSSFGGARTTLLLTPTKVPAPSSPLRRSSTLRNHNNIQYAPKGTDGNPTGNRSNKVPMSTPSSLQRNQTVRSHHSRNSSVISRNSSRHGRIIRLEQKATKVLGVVFFTFVILWAPFFVLNLLPTVCGRCEDNISYWVFDVVTWLGYASSMVNPIFYTIFNKVFRQAFKKVLLCKYGGNTSEWRPNR